jgi:Ankyrin repeats (3 copies)
VPTRSLPGDPSLEHLKAQAKLLQRRVRERAGDALELVREFHPRMSAVDHESPEPDAFSRADAQLVVARRYGFASWNRLRRHIEVVERYTRSPHHQPVGGPTGSDQELADEFLRLACLIYSNDDPARWRRAGELLRSHPQIAGASIHAAAGVGDVSAARRILAADPAAARAEGGPHRWEPLLYAAYSRLDSTQPGHSTLEVARLLLQAGADPDAGYLWEGLPSPFTALTGAFGRGEGNPPPHQFGTDLARLLLEAGADANDSQTIYNRSFDPDVGPLELLLRYGLGRGTGGPWHARLGPAHPTPEQMAQDALIWATFNDHAERVRLLVASGVVDLDGRGTQHPVVGGRAALELALATGNGEIADILVRAGATPPALDAAGRFEAAVMRADRAAVEELLAADPDLAAKARVREPALVVRAAEHGRIDAVRLLVACGFDVNATQRKTALHEAAFRGDMALVNLLLDMGADPTIRDRDHGAPPLGWAEHNGKQEVAARLRAVMGKPG